MAQLALKTTESTSRTQTQTFTIPGLTKLNGVTVNTGTVEIVSIVGDKVTVKTSGGSVSRSVQTGGSYTPADSKSVSNSRTSSSNSFPTSVSYSSGGYSGSLSKSGSVSSRVVSGTYTPEHSMTVTGQTSANYNSGGYTGTLTQYLYSGTPADSKTVTTTTTDFTTNNVYDQNFRGATRSYSSGGYTGTLTYVNGSLTTDRRDGGVYYDRTWTGTVSKPDTRVYRYQGTVTRPASDTRVYEYTQNYSGTVTRPASDTRTYTSYYQYSVTFNYGTNTDPTVLLNTPNNVTLYENDTFLVDGSALDTDNGNVVIVRYQINNGTTVAIETKVSDGTTPISFSRQLTFKGGKLHYNGVEVTGALAEGTAHKLKVWAVDDQGGQAEIAERTFYVVPNRAPSLTIDPFESLADLIDVDRVAMSGDSHDPDGNDVIVRYRINNGLNVEIHNGPAGPWSFDFPLSKLKDGENTIVVEVVDTYDSKYSLTKKLYRSADLTPLDQSVYRGTITPPAGSAQGVFLWIKRDETQEVSIEISMTNGTEPENFVQMTLDSSGPDGIGIVEDFFKYRADAPSEKIAIKLSWTGDKPIHQIQGALTQ